jgi:hypothetical protein
MMNGDSLQGAGFKAQGARHKVQGAGYWVLDAVATEGVPGLRLEPFIRRVDFSKKVSVLTGSLYSFTPREKLSGFSQSGLSKVPL